MIQQLSTNGSARSLKASGSDRKAYMVGSGIGSLAAAAFMIRDGGIPGHNITIYEAMPVLGGSLDGGGNATDGYTLRGGRMLTTDNYECTWGLFKSIPSVMSPGMTVFDETIAFNARNKSHSRARLVDRHRARIDVESMGFSMQDRFDLLKLTEADEAKLGDSRITDWGTIAIGDDDLVFFQNGSMTDASSFGSMTSAPRRLTKHDSGGWALWERLAAGHPEFGNPAAFNSSIPESFWESYTVTLRDTAFFDKMEAFSGNRAGTGGLVTFKDSNWFMSIVLAHQPHFINQPADARVFWGYALHPDRIGNFVAKPMSDCTGNDILHELCGHLNFDLDMVASATCIPCRMPYITSMFMPRAHTDRPLPVPKNSKNLAFVSQFVEIPEDVVFTVEYSVRVAQMAVYELLGITREIPPILHHDKSIKVQLDAVVKAFR